MKRKLKVLFKRLCDLYYVFIIKNAEKKKIKSKKKIYKNILFDKDKISDIKDRYGTTDVWHKYYTSFTGKYDLNYIPEIIFSTEMELKMNDRKSARELSNKSLLKPLFGSINELYIPKQIVLFSNNSFFDANNEPITYKKANEIIKNYMDNNGIIKKPILDSNSGKNVELYKKYNANILTIDGDYIIQELVENNSEIKKLNPNSLNTMRIVTYITKRGYKCAPIILRIGGSKSHLDNAHAGGMFIAVDDNGFLSKEAYTEYGGKYKNHPLTGIEFNNYYIGDVSKIKDIAIKRHKMIPQFKIISWDLTINNKEKPTLIEANLFGQTIWFIQIAHGTGIFGEDTEEMLENYRKDNNYVR